MIRKKLLLSVVLVATAGACTSKNGDDAASMSNAGTAAGGSSGAAGGSSGGSSGMESTGGSGGASPCAETCALGATCRMGVCTCPSNKPDICDDTCVDLQTNPNYCGNCTTHCDPGAACSAGVCGATPTPVTTVTGCGTLHLAIDATHLYWADSGQGTVSKIPLAGGTATNIATGQMRPASLAVDAAGVYWSNLDDQTVMKAPLPDGAPATLVREPAVINGIAVGGGFVFYTQGQDVYKVATTGGASTFLAESPAGDAVPLACPAPPDAGAPDGGVEVGGGLPVGLFLDSTRVYWTANNRQAVESALLTGGPDCTGGYVEIGESQGSLLLPVIGAAGAAAYWANGERIVTANLTACEAGGSCVGVNSTLTETADFDPVTSFAISSSNIYFAGKDGGIFKAPLTGNDVTATGFARDQMQADIGGVTKPTEAGSMVVSATHLYWATSDCKIMSLPL